MFAAQAYTSWSRNVTAHSSQLRRMRTRSLQRAWQVQQRGTRSGTTLGYKNGVVKRCAPASIMCTEMQLLADRCGVALDSRAIFAVTSCACRYICTAKHHNGNACRCALAPAANGTNHIITHTKPAPYVGFAAVHRL